MKGTADRIENALARGEVISSETLILDRGVFLIPSHSGQVVGCKIVYPGEGPAFSQYGQHDRPEPLVTRCEISYEVVK